MDLICFGLESLALFFFFIPGAKLSGAVACEPHAAAWTRTRENVSQFVSKLLLIEFRN